MLLCRPENVLEQVSLTERTAVVTMTHNYLHDLELLRNLLPMSLRYLGCLGPRRRNERLLLEVAEGDERLANDYRQQLQAPIGLDIGAETAEEIALAIVSEIKALLSDRRGGQLRDRKGKIHGALSVALPLVVNSSLRYGDSASGHGGPPLQYGT